MFFERRRGGRVRYWRMFGVEEGDMVWGKWELGGGREGGRIGFRGGKRVRLWEECYLLSFVWVL